jgi:hypothetical protein
MSSEPVASFEGTSLDLQAEIRLNELSDENSQLARELRMARGQVLLLEEQVGLLETTACAYRESISRFMGLLPAVPPASAASTYSRHTCGQTNAIGRRMLLAS